MRKLFFLLAFVFVMACWGGVGAQTVPADFEGLQVQGPVPADLRLSMEQLYAMDKQRVRDYTDGRLPNRDKILEESYCVNKLMVSGRILYGDPITRMIEGIADTLLKDYPALRKELRFYAVKSPEVNAFATGQGMIFVNTGLVAQSENEAQLAFVLSHEIIHYFKNHNLEVLTRKQTKSLDDEERQMQDFLKYHSRSHEMENEADSLGLAMFYMGSPYDKRVTDGVFDVLQYGYLPFDEVPFDTAYFNTPLFHLPHDYFLDQLAPITARDDYNDSLSTHPNILKRRNRTADMLAPYQGGSLFVTLTPQEFADLRTLARFEDLHTELVYAEYARAFYDAYLLQRQFPDNLFVARALGQSLYGMAKYKSYSGGVSAEGDYTKMEGEVQQVYYLLHKMQGEEMTLVAAHKLYELRCQFPDDARIAAMCDDLFADLGGKHGMKRTLFAKEFRPPLAENVEDAVVDGKSAKYQRIKQKKRSQEQTDLRTYAFADLLQKDSTFDAYLTNILAPKYAEERKVVKKYHRQLLYAPGYYILVKKGVGLDYLQSNRHETELVDMVEQMAAENGIESVDFSDQSLQAMNTDEQYNEFVAMNAWAAEYWRGKGNVPMINSMQPAMDRLRKKYDADLVSCVTVLNGPNHDKGSNLFALTCGVILVPLLPVALESTISGSEDTWVYTTLIDAATGRKAMTRRTEMNLNNSKANVNSPIYDAYRLLQHGGDTIHESPSGYLGKRCLVSVGVNAGLNRYGLNIDDNPMVAFGNEEARRATLSLVPTCTLEWTVNKERSLTFGISYVPTRYNCSYDVVEEIDYGYSSSYTINTKTATLDENILNLSLSYRKYNSGALAPLGHYSYLGVDCHRVALPNVATTELSVPEVRYLFGANFGTGRNYMLGNRISMGYNLRYSLTFANPSLKKIGGFESLPNDQLQRNAQNRDVWLRSCFNIEFTIGLLPF